MADKDYIVKESSQVDLKEGLLAQRHKQLFCDITLTTTQENFPCHRCVLAAKSNYFAKLLIEQKQEILDLSPICNSDLKADYLGEVINFMYGSSIQINQENINNVLVWARLFQLDELENICLKFLLNNLRLQNCMESWLIATKYNLKSLGEIAESFSLARFHDTLIDSEEVLSLTVEQLLILLPYGLGRFCGSDKMRYFLQTYIKQDPESRAKHEASLFEASEVLRVDTVGSTKFKPQENPSELVDKVKHVEAMLWQLNKQYVVYNTQRDGYFKVPNLEHLSGDWSVHLLGIGVNLDYALITKGNQSNYLDYAMITRGNQSNSFRKLFNIFTKETCDLPIIPAKGFESVSKSSIRGDEILGCYNGELFCVFKSILVLDRKAMSIFGKEPSSKNFGDEKTELLDQSMTVVFIQRFDSAKWKWKLLGNICETEEQNVKIGCLFRNSPCCFVLVQSRGKVDTFSVNLETHKFTVLETLELPHIEPHVEFYEHSSRLEMNIVGGSNNLLVEIGKNVYIYNIEIDEWKESKEINPEIFERCLLLSRSDGYIYQKESNKNRPVFVFSLDPFTQEKRELCPPPLLNPRRSTYHSEEKPRIVTIPSSVLDHFEAVSMTPYIKQRLLEEWDVREIIENEKRELNLNQ